MADLKGHIRDWIHEYIYIYIYIILLFYLLIAVLTISINRNIGKTREAFTSLAEKMLRFSSEIMLLKLPSLSPAFSRKGRSNGAFLKIPKIADGTKTDHYGEGSAPGPSKNALWEQF